MQRSVEKNKLLEKKIKIADEQKECSDKLIRNLEEQNRDLQEMLERNDTVLETLTYRIEKVKAEKSALEKQQELSDSVISKMAGHQQTLEADCRNLEFVLSQGDI